MNPVEKNGGRTGRIGAKEKRCKERLCQGAEGMRRTGEREGRGTGGK
jgi:hypothetical protein